MSVQLLRRAEGSLTYRNPGPSHPSSAYPCWVARAPARFAQYPCPPESQLADGSSSQAASPAAARDGRLGRPRRSQRRERKERSRRSPRAQAKRPFKSNNACLKTIEFVPSKRFFPYCSGGSALTTDSSREESAEGVERKAAPGVRQGRVRASTDRFAESRGTGRVPPSCHATRTPSNRIPGEPGRQQKRPRA